MRRRARMIVAAAILFTVGAAVAGCSQLPFHDESYRARIPDALQEAELGISAAWAEVGLSGFVETLYVGGTLEITEESNKAVSTKLVGEVIDVVLSNTPPPSTYLQLSFRDSKDTLIDLSSTFQELDVAVRGDGSISMEDAKSIAKDEHR